MYKSFLLFRVFSKLNNSLSSVLYTGSSLASVIENRLHSLLLLKKLVCVKQDVEMRDQAVLASADFAIKIGNITYTERTDGGTGMLEAI